MVDTSASGLETAGSTAELQLLLQQTDSPARQAARRKASLDMQRRLVQPYVAQEAALAAMPLGELYALSLATAEGGFTDFQRERARQILDAHMQPLQEQG